jgi:hypothetical protein
VLPNSQSPISADGGAGDKNDHAAAHFRFTGQYCSFTKISRIYGPPPLPSCGERRHGFVKRLSLTNPLIGRVSWLK